MSEDADQPRPESRGSGSFIAGVLLEAIDALRQQIAVLDETGTIVAVNRAWREFAEQNVDPGQPVPASVGINYLAVCQVPFGTPGSDDASAAYAGIRSILEGQLPIFSMEYRCDSPTEKRWFRMTVTPLASRGGAVCSHENISGIRRSEAARAEAEQYLSVVGWHVPGMIGYWDRELRCRFANQAYLDWYGLTPDQLIGARMQDVQPAQFFREIEPHLRAAFDGTGQNIEREVEGRDGSSRHLWARFIPHVKDDEVRGLVALIVDITERKRREMTDASFMKRVQETQKMEALGTLAGGIAGDLNNVMATILSHVELAVRQKGTPPLVQESLEGIWQAGTHAHNLLGQIISFSHHPPRPHEEQSLASLIRSAEGLLRARLPENVRLELRCDADTPPVLADADEIVQVLISLTANAIQSHLGKPGRVEIRLERVTLDPPAAGGHPALEAFLARHPGPLVRLSVTDTGAGMEEGTLGRAFEPYFTTKEVGQGRGLGLAVAHGIVRTHKGVIVAESKPGEGSTFSVYLPPAAEAKEPPKTLSPSRAQPSSASKARLHVLCVDDNPSLLRPIELVLQRKGYEVTTYEDPIEALEEIRARPDKFDIVVTDFNMPRLSGLDLLREVLTLRPDLPTGILSGFFDADLREKAAALGVREQIPKGVMRDLYEAVARLALAGR